MAQSDSLNLSQEIRQQQTLAPMQLQYVKMLEMNAPEIEDEVQRAIDENPALESDPTSVITTQDDRPYYKPFPTSASDSPSYTPEPYEIGESMMESLMSQLLQAENLTDAEIRIAQNIIGNIDANGYLTRTPAMIADDISILTGTDVTTAAVHDIWQKIRLLDPAGIAASDLRDCLLLQLNRIPSTQSTDDARNIVRDYFDLFSLMHFPQIRSALGLTEERLRRAMDVIKSLNPKPGRQFGSAYEDKTSQISPDFTIDSDPDGILTLSLVNNIPALNISRSFAADTEVKGKSELAERSNAFIRQRRDDAAGFIRALSMRQQTLFRVMSAIMQWQRKFFETNNPATLRPMILKDISSVTGDDISVISRATAGKYVATAHGVFPLRYFFNEPRPERGDTSTHSVMELLREIIENEDKSNPLSDRELTDELIKKGVDIARRTVAKYREKMGFPVGRLRKSI